MGPLPHSAPRVCGDDPSCVRHMLDKAGVLPAYAGMILQRRGTYAS